MAALVPEEEHRVAWLYVFGCDCFSYNCYVLLYSFMCLVIIVCFTPRRLAPRRVAVRRPGVRPPLLKRWGDCRLPRRASTPRAKGATLDTSSPHGRVLRWLQSPEPKITGGQEALGPAKQA